MNTTPMDTFAGLDGCMEQHPTGSRKCPGSVPQPAIWRNFLRPTFGNPVNIMRMTVAKTWKKPSSVPRMAYHYRYLSLRQAQWPSCAQW